VLIDPEHETYQLVSDYRKYRKVKRIYLSPLTKRVIEHNAVCAAVEIDRYLRGIYAR